jgi:hypothetical protein
MAILALSYCNASLGKTINFNYDNVVHTVSGVVVGAACSPGLLAGEVIYSHGGGTTYSVRASNVSPYAYVTSVDDDCTLAINDVDITNATTDAEADGAILITASAPGGGSSSIYYSIDGINWQTSNVFSGLAPGTYTVRVRKRQKGNDCFDNQEVTVGYDALSVCDLVLGNVATTDGPGGTLTVLGYTTIHTDQPVEYRLGVGAWQESASFTGLAAGTYSVQIRFKNFTACNNSRNVTLSNCDLLLTGVDVTSEQTRYSNDGAISVHATTSNEPLEYSKDDGATWQSESIFDNLAPGVYAIRVRDNNACEVFASVEVFRYKKAVVVFPIANANRVVITDGPVQDTGMQNFDNTLFADMAFPAREHGCFKQPNTIADLVPMQWRSSYDNHTVKIYNSAGALQGTLTPIKRTEYIGYTETLDANFSNYGDGKTQIWFPTGLPTFIEIGQSVTIAGQVSLNGTYEIKDIVAGTLEAEGFQSLIVTKNYTEGTDPLTGTVSITYNIEEYEIWEVVIDWSAYAAGEYYLMIEGTDDQLEDFTAHSEPIQTQGDSDEMVKVTAKNIDNAYLIDYSTGIEHMLWLPEAELIPVEPGGEKEVMEDSRRRVVKLREFVTRQVQLNVFAIPHWLVEKIKLALAHDIAKINDVQYEAVDAMSVEMPDPTETLCNISVRLRQVDFIAENSDDDGDVDSVVLDLGGGTILELEP